MTATKENIKETLLILGGTPEERSALEASLSGEGFSAFDTETLKEEEADSTDNPCVQPAMILALSPIPENAAEIKEEYKVPLLAILDEATPPSFADDFIIKPVKYAELTTRIERKVYACNCTHSQSDGDALQSILAITNAISASLEISTIFDIIVGRVAEALCAEDCSIVLIDKDGSGTVLQSFLELPMENLRIDINKYPEISEVLGTRQALAITDIASHPLMQDVRGSVKNLSNLSALVIPIVFDDDVLGTMFLRAKRHGMAFTENEINLCRLVAEASFFSIKNARLYDTIKKEKEKLKKIAISDPLTGLYNHNYFYKRLEEEFNRASRYGMPLSVVMMDIDNFKAINDTYGHPVGDVVLRKVSALLKNCVRKSDIVARYGGEEFAEVLTYTQKNGAAEEAERIRALVESLSFEDEGLDIKVTLSLGVAEYDPNNVPSSGEMVNLADKALYRAKDGGKNCVKLA